VQLPRRSFINAIAVACAALACNAFAQTYPTKPVRVVVTFPPGGSSDVVARHVSPLLAERLGQQFVVDNRPGAGATIGAGEVARAAPDGYTLMLSNTAPISLSPFMLEPPRLLAAFADEPLPPANAPPPPPPPPPDFDG